MGKLRETLKYLTRGISSIIDSSVNLLDIGATFYRPFIHPIQDLISMKEDALAFRDDWGAIGRDLESAMKKVGEEINYVPKQP